MIVPHYEMLGKDRVVISLEDFEDMLDALSYDDAKADRRETVSPETALRLIRGENPLRVWREHAGLSQTDLAARAGTKQSLISEIEAGRKTGSVETLRALATAWNVDLDDLVRA